MKSFLSGSALAVLSLVCLADTASAQYTLYSPSMLPASAHSQTAVRLPINAYPRSSTVPVAAGPFAGQATYSVYNNNFADVFGAPPPSAYIGGPPQPVPSQHMYSQPMLPAYGMGAINSGAYGCGDCGSCNSCLIRRIAIGSGNWFGSVSALLMTPDRTNPYFFSYDRDNEVDQLTASRDAEIQWGGGFDVRFGRYFNCRRNAVEVV